MVDTLKLLISLSLPFIIAIIGGFATRNSVSTWYKKLNKPKLNPPGWIFGPVWTTLYIFMSISFYLIWTTQFTYIALTLYIAQLLLNLGWSILFFGLEKPAWAFKEIIMLWIAILANIVYFSQINTLAAYLLIPYLLWVSYASILNYQIYKLNY